MVRRTVRPRILKPRRVCPFVESKMTTLADRRRSLKVAVDARHFPRDVAARMPTPVVARAGLRLESCTSRLVTTEIDRSANPNSEALVSTNEPLLQTPLHDWHQSHGGRLVEFGGWSMPVQYTTIVEEHQAVRQRVGLFDISHMGRLTFDGPGVLEWLERVTTNQVARLPISRSSIA